MKHEFENRLDAVWQKVDSKLAKVAVRSRDKIPYTTDENGVHDDKSQSDPCFWTNGFFGGMMWLMYAATKNDEYLKTARRNEELLDAAFKKYDSLHHDVGFMWHILSGADYRLTGDKDARLRNLYAANILAGRYNIKGGYIAAWNNWCGEDHRTWTIIDCMMNIPLLYWASAEKGDDRYKYIAMAHADMAMNDHVRPDGSVRHIVVHHLEEPGVEKVLGGQGYNEHSSWSRGAAWAIYGFALSYIHTGKQEYLDTAKRVAHFFIAACCSDWKVRADFRTPEEPVEYDSTAAACAACGLLEIAKLVPEHEKKMYRDAALNLLSVIDENWCNYDENIDYLVGMGTELYREDPHDRAVHLPIIYGDYFFVEALTKLKDVDFLAW